MTPKQHSFCREFHIDGNATQAAIRAGYSPRTAYSIGHENLNKPDIAARIAEQAAARFAHLDLTAERLDREVARMSYFTVANVLGDDGEPDLSRASDDDLAALASVERSERGLKVKAHNKVAAIKLAYRRLGLLTDRVEVSASEDFAALMEAADKRANR